MYVCSMKQIISIYRTFYFALIPIYLSMSVHPSIKINR